MSPPRLRVTRDRDIAGLLSVSTQPQEEQFLHWGTVGGKKNSHKNTVCQRKRFHFPCLYDSGRSQQQPHPIPPGPLCFRACNYCQHLHFTEKASQALLWTNPDTLAVPGSYRVERDWKSALWCLNHGTGYRHPHAIQGKVKSWGWRKDGEEKWRGQGQRVTLLV